MRLSPIERKALDYAVKDISYEVFLFGSRCDNERKGGDVDVLIMAPQVSEGDRAKMSLSVASKFQMICDEKIDVVVLDPQNLSQPQEAFLSLIQRETIKGC